MVCCKLSLLALFLFGFVGIVNGTQNTQQLGLNEGKSDLNGKTSTTTITTTTTVKSDDEATTTKAPNPKTACGGLKGFLHLCERIEDGNTAESEKGKEGYEGSGDKNEKKDQTKKESKSDGVKFESSTFIKREVEKKKYEESDESEESASSSSEFSAFEERVVEPKKAEFQRELNREKNSSESEKDDHDGSGSSG